MTNERKEDGAKSDTPDRSEKNDFFSLIEDIRSIDDVTDESDIERILAAKKLEAGTSEWNEARDAIFDLLRTRKDEVKQELKQLYAELDPFGRGHGFTTSRMTKISLKVSGFENNFQKKRNEWKDLAYARADYSKKGGVLKRNKSQMTVAELQSAAADFQAEQAAWKAKLDAKEAEAKKIGVFARKFGEAKEAYQKLQVEIAELSAKARKAEGQVLQHQSEINFKKRMHGPDEREISEADFQAGLPQDPGPEPVLGEDLEYRALKLEEAEEAERIRGLTQEMRKKEDLLYHMALQLGYEPSEDWGAEVNIRRDLVESDI